MGGGIGGLTAAIALTHAGHDVTVYEQAPALGEVGAGIGLWPNALGVLGRLGLGDAALELAGGGVGIGLRRADGRWLMRHSADDLRARWGAPFACVHRAELHALLVDALGGVSVKLGARCTGFEERGGIVTMRFDGEHDGADAELLVGADGIRSSIGTTLWGPPRLRYRGYHNWRGIAAADRVPLEPFTTDNWGRGRHFGLQPTSGGRMLWYAGVNVAEGAPAGGSAREFLLDAFAGWRAPIAEVIGATADGAIVRSEARDTRPRRVWGRGAVTLLGDAIHPDGARSRPGSLSGDARRGGARRRTRAGPRCAVGARRLRAPAGSHGGLRRALVAPLGGGGSARRASRLRAARRLVGRDAEHAYAAPARPRRAADGVTERGGRPGRDAPGRGVSSRA